jgi:nicotinate-nucleotide adenylyltransferase
MIGIYGGTFDPVHFGHLRPALDVLEGIGLEQVRFIPCGQPPHRQQPVASAEQRLAMVSLAVSEQPGFIVDDREISRGGMSYMVDTLTSLKQEKPHKTFCLILGMDAFIEFEQWKRWQDILQMVNLVVTHRPNADFDSEKTGHTLNEYLVNHRQDDINTFLEAPAGKILFYPVTQLDISSTRVRNCIRDGKNIRYLLPQVVTDYIQQNRIYQ